MKPTCPIPNCNSLNPAALVVKDGTFYRRSQSRKIQRFLCRGCGRKFSHATGSLEFRQKKRTLNSVVQGLLCSKVSQRRIAFLLKISRTTVDRKLLFLARKARRDHNEFLKSKQGQVQHMQFDDMISSEHSKMKPVTISLAVDADTREILSVKAEPISASGHLAERSRKKYGRRKSRHKLALKRLFAEITPTISKYALVQSDEHKFYREFVERYLPQCEYRQHIGGRGCIAGQGELKKKRFDPLFQLNHTCAFIRDSVGRLVRRTWGNTKKVERLEDHLTVFLDFYNRVYLARMRV